MCPSKLPDPAFSYYFRNPYNPKALYNARKKVEQRYPGQSIPTIMNGDYRAKDAFSVTCVNIEAELAKGTPGKGLLSALSSKAPIIRRDMHPDDIQPTKTIHYSPSGGKGETWDDNYSFDCLILHEKRPTSISKKAAQRAKAELTKHGVPQNNRVPLSDAFVKALGTFEQGDISTPLSPNKKKPVPSVISAQHILHYFTDPKKLKQTVQNFQDTQAEGSYLVVGSTEVRNLPNLSDLLQRHSYVPEEEENLRIKVKAHNNKEIRDFRHHRSSIVQPFVYVKNR
jgi:hypothetical protein